MHEATYIASGILWPASILLMFGMYVGANPERKLARLETQRQAELARATHEATIAAQREIEAKALQRELINLGLQPEEPLPMKELLLQIFNRWRRS